MNWNQSDLERKPLSLNTGSRLRTSASSSISGQSRTQRKLSGFTIALQTNTVGIYFASRVRCWRLHGVLRIIYRNKNYHMVQDWFTSLYCDSLLLLSPDLVDRWRRLLILISSEMMFYWLMVRWWLIPGRRLLIYCARWVELQQCRGSGVRMNCAPGLPCVRNTTKALNTFQSRLT